MHFNSIGLAKLIQIEALGVQGSIFEIWEAFEKMFLRRFGVGKKPAPNRKDQLFGQTIRFRLQYLGGVGGRSGLVGRKKRRGY